MEPLMRAQTPNQTVGPFFQDALLSGGENVLVNDLTRGRRIYVTGKVLDGDGAPVPDALIEIWQADAQGFFNHPNDPNHARADKNFRAFGRSDTRAAGTFRFETIKPGCVPASTGGQPQAPHISVRVFARGMLLHVLTRIYFSDERANEHDALLNSIGDPQRRQTLIAALDESAGLPTYRFDIHLQGERETAFFEP
jgi:protocatechuate 3,4-dioxygenase, alpha subunit